MTYDAAAHLCFCDADSVPVPGGCEVCAAGLVAQGVECGCPVGMILDGAGACVAIPGGLGVACAAATPCTDEAYATCGPAGYCTHECASNVDCEGGYVCAVKDASPTCKKPPSGIGEACATQDDCAAFDASTCETGLLHQCIVSGCSLSPNDCPGGWACCDLSAYGAPEPLCFPEGGCPSAP